MEHYLLDGRDRPFDRLGSRLSFYVMLFLASSTDSWQHAQVSLNGVLYVRIGRDDPIVVAWRPTDLQGAVASPSAGLRKRRTCRSVARSGYITFRDVTPGDRHERPRAPTRR